MNRICIPEGTTIQFNNVSGTRTYVVGKVIGKGANCIAYEGHSNDSVGRRVRIKECYPAEGNVHRVGLSIEWSDKCLKESMFDKFKLAYKKQVSIQNDTEFGNTVTHVVDDLCEANNTLYTIVDIDNGVTFDNDKSQSLREILNTVLALSKVVQTYHVRGYLHLDIKPENFMVIPETRDIIKLIDVDTITQKDDIISGNSSVIPYSCGWAAPEQIQRKRRKISEKTDIFSIGAILFSKIMGRCPSNDDIGVYSEYDIPKDVIQKYDSRIDAVLKAIFEKTIAASMNRRYDDISALISALDDAIHICSNDKYIMARESVSNVYFVGRKHELKTIHDKFKTGTKAIFLHGFGGIGKTELAKRYVQEYKNEYDVTIFDRYSEDKGIERYIEDIVIHGIDKDEDNCYEKKYKQIKNYSSQNTLFVIDNFDVDNDKKLDDLLSLDAKILFTSRNDHTDYCSDCINQMELETMEINDLMQLFEHEYGKVLDNEEISYVRKIIGKFDNYTMMVPLIAKQIKAGETSIKEFWDKIEAEGLAIFGDDSEKIKHRKDGVVTQASLMGHMNHLFNLSELDEEHKRVLANIKDLEYHCGLTKSVYREYTQSANLTKLNELIDRGWINKYYKYDYGTQSDILYLQLHPVISDLIEESLYNAEYHKDILNYVNNKMDDFIQQPDNELLRDNLANVMAAYSSVVEIDPDCNLIFDKLYSVYEHEYLNNNLNVKNLLYYSSQFNTDASETYFVDKIFQVKENILSDNPIDRLHNVCMYIAFLSYAKCRVATYENKNSFEKTAAAVYVSTMNKCLRNISLLMPYDDDEKITESIDAVVITREDVNRFAVLIKTITCYTNCKPLDEYKWIVNDRDHSNFNILEPFAINAEMYLLVAEMAIVLAGYYEKYDEAESQFFHQLYKNILLVMEYYQGDLKNPITYVPNDINDYKNKWESTVNIRFVSEEIDRTIGDDEVGVRLCICEDKNKWRRQLGKSIDSICKEDNLTYDVYKMLLEYNFLNNQPAIVRNTILKNCVYGSFLNCDNLAQENRKNLLVDYILQQIEIFIASKHNRKSKKEISKKISTILDIYYLCLNKYAKYYFDKAGTELTNERYSFYQALIYICSYRKYKCIELADAIEKEINCINVEHTYLLLKLVNGIWTIGLSKKTEFLKKKLMTFWAVKENVKDKSSSKWICYLYDMKEVARRLKCFPELEEINDEIANLDINEMVNAVDDKNIELEHRIEIAKEIYWFILEQTASILEQEGYEGLLCSDDFKELCSIGCELSTALDKVSTKNYRVRQFVENLMDVIKGVPRRHYVNRYMTSYYKTVYKNSIRYDAIDNYIGGRYILLAEILLGKSKAKMIFNQIEGSVQAKSEAFIEIEDYLNSDECNPSL